LKKLAATGVATLRSSFPFTLRDILVGGSGDALCGIMAADR